MHDHSKEADLWPRPTDADAVLLSLAAPYPVEWRRFVERLDGKLDRLHGTREEMQALVQDMLGEVDGLGDLGAWPLVREAFQERLVAVAAAAYRLGVRLGRRAALAGAGGADVALATAQVESLREQQSHLADMAIRLAALARGMGRAINHSG